MRHPRIILPLAFLFLLGTSLFLLLPQKLVVDFSQVPTVSDGNVPLAQNVEPEEGGSLPARKSVADLGPEMKSTRWEGLTKALDRGLPVGLRTAIGETETYWMRPRSTVTKDFQITLGNARSSILFAKPRVYEGFRFHGEARADGVGDLDSPLTDRAFFAIVGDSFAAVIQKPDGTIREISTDVETGQLEQVTRHSPEIPYSCRLDPRTRIAAVSTADPAVLAQDAPSEPVEILPPVLPQGGEDPATGDYSKIIDTIIGGQLYEVSLKNAHVLVVMDKEATGSDSIGNLTGKASVQLCRMANISAMYENQIGTRILVQELIMTPKTADYDDIPSSLGNFKSWAEKERPRNEFPRMLGVKAGKGLSGTTLGLGYIGALKGSYGYCIVRPGYDHALLGHEMGHNFGSGHSDGGVMNANWRRTERNFFTKVDGGDTAAKKIYSHAKSRLNGPAALRHPEEIPFAENDFAKTNKDEAVTLEPLQNDKTFVINGEENRLSIAELGPVFPIGAGMASVSGGEVTFTPEENYTGMAWFSYSLRGDVGNNGKGWLHKGDVAIEVQSGQSDTKLILRPGDSHIYYPSGNGDLTVKSQPGKARADRTGDDKQAIIIRVNADATGTDSFIYRKNNNDHTVQITYAEAGPVTRPDILVYDTTEDMLWFNPILNDEIPGTRTPQPTFPVLGVGTVDRGITGTNLYPNGYKLISAKLLDASKGTLSTATTPYFVNAKKVDVKNGFMKFEPKSGASGLAKIEYTVEDAAGNRKTEAVVILLNLVTITSPSVETALIHQDSGLLLEGTTHASSDPPLSGNLSTRWTVTSNPKNSRVTFDDADSPTTGAWFSHPGTYVLRLTASDDGGYGTFDEISVQVDLAHSSNSDPNEQLVGWWKLDENKGIKTGDTSGNGFVGTLSGPIWKTGVQGSSLEFDGQDDYVDLLPPSILIETGATWKYLDTGQDPGATWRDSDFDDSSWKSGAAQLGYGNDGEKTIISHGSNASQKYPAYYFRHSFEIDEIAANSAATIRFQRDDAVAIYWNGQQIYRDANLPDDATHQTYATSTISNENEWKTVRLPQALLIAGTHTISTEVHQASGTSSDTRFSMDLQAAIKPAGKILNLSQGSVSLWFRTAETSRMTLLSAGDTTDPDRDWKLYLDDGRVHYQVRGDGGTDTTAFRATKKLSDNNWHNVFLKVDPANNAVFYIDGKWIAKETRPFFGVVQDSSILQLGRSLTSAGASDYFKGRIDDVRIYARPLYMNEIERLSHANVNRGPVITLPTSTVKSPFDPFDLGLINPTVEDDGRSNPKPTYQWSILSGAGSLEFDNPNILSPSIDFGEKGSCRLRLSADDGQIRTFRDLDVEYVDGGNQKPMSLGIGNLQINENADALAINLHDAFEDLQDADSGLKFTIVGNTNPSLFENIQIKGNPDKLHVTPANDTLGSGKITIRATDTDGNTADTAFTINLHNQPPTIGAQTFYLQENSPAGTLAGTIHATDPDGDTPQFKIVSGNGQGLFTIDPATGRFTVAEGAVPDYETTQSHTLVVAATDVRNPSPDNNAQIRIHIVNQNEAPTLGDAIFDITDSVKAGDIIGPISGNDPEGDSLTFDITEGNDDGLFAIDANGILSIAKTSDLDALKTPRRQITIRARDPGEPRLAGNGSIRINISRQVFSNGSTLLHLVPADDSVDINWMQPDFDAATWNTGKLGVGYDTNTDYDPILGSDLENAMSGKTASAYLRIPFQIPNTSAVSDLRLQFIYDDGCILYLNGQKVYEVNAPQNPAWDSVATALHEADLSAYEEIDLSPHLNSLQAGTNFLAVHLLNEKKSSSDLIFDGRLQTSAAGTPVAPNPATIEATGTGIVGRITAKPAGRVVRANGEQPRLTLVLDTTDRGKSLTAWSRHVELPSFTGENFSIDIDQLEPSTTYFYAFYGANRGGISWTSTANSFTTRANQAPSSKPEEYRAVADTPLTVKSDQGLLANDSDPEKDSLTVRILSQPAKGTLILAADGSFTYTPNPGFIGTDFFTYITADTWDDATSNHGWIARGDTWKYRDAASAPDPAWHTLSFEDTSWESGPAELGYGDNDEKTILSFGADSRNKTPTYYFRKSFTLPAGSKALSAKLLFKRDDAAVLYLNGAEIHRDNNLAKNASHDDYATSNVPNENTYVQANFDSSLLLPGKNLLAAEVHQGNATSSDLGFDLELTGTLRAETTATIVVEQGGGNTDTDSDGLPDAWEQTHFGAVDAEPTADPDSDRLPNLIEYALGTNPAFPTTWAPAPALVLDTGKTYFEITYTRRRGTTLVFNLQASTDLNAWESADALLETTTTDNGDGSETVMSRLKQAIEANSSQFVRLQVSSQ